MTTVIRRRSPLIASLIALGLVLGACASGPNQVNSAAIVGGKTIGVNEVQDLVDKAVKVEPAVRVLADQRKLNLVSRAVLRQLVLHELIADYSTKQRVTVEPAQVTQLAEQISASLQEFPDDGSASPEAIVQQAVNRAFDAEYLARDYLLLAQFGREQLSKLSVTFDFTLVAAGEQAAAGSLRGQAVDKAKQMAQSPEAAAKVIDADVAAGAQAAKGETLTPALAPEIAGTVIFGAPAGSVIAFQPNPEQANWVVAVIHKRGFDGKPAAEKEDDPRVATSLGRRLLQSTGEELGIKISPRYGVWDASDMNVAADDSLTVGVVFPIKNAKQQ
ncbi:SurA N-terminal domain-containing protein [Actinokineospora diospyrosa]|uniref:SurA N-terminal domain-containing protein n=1 Tax=Actinokineospora diospyrosa TaxID=103728 RepID=A0ABT1IGG5_9PSEU|nr:SurA N-terminal domain-containing protein [Actinokineospora diospyrosa]MCP2271654.1 SurA N-terminal domain-containing protein [Actinokineospora diospyrosa]